MSFLKDKLRKQHCNAQQEYVQKQNWVQHLYLAAADIGKFICYTNSQDRNPLLSSCKENQVLNLSHRGREQLDDKICTNHGWHRRYP
jgi:hypothetical protein